MSSFSRKLFVSIFALALVFVAIFLIGFLNRKAPEAMPVQVVEKNNIPKRVVIGKSVEGREIESFTYGKGIKQLIFVGGMHGGYEWNSVLLAYEFMDYLKGNPEAIPDDVSLTVIPALNVDGVYKVTGKEGRFLIDDVSTDKNVLASGRFNANNVDLNRNFDCKWQPKSTWQSKTVSAGKSAFSEPEALAFKNFVSDSKPEVVVFWHSQSNAVYASECEDGILAGTIESMNAYAKAAGYPAVESFSAYKITGDSEGWLASIGIPAITVELKTHDSIEWDKNLSGIRALVNLYSQE